MKTFILATQNAGKVKEVRDIAGDSCEVITMGQAGLSLDIEETGNSFAENALIKARAVWNAQKEAGESCLVMADDSGLEIDFFDKKPGIYSSRWLGEDTPYTEKNRIVLERMEKAEPSQRTARYVCAMAAILPSGEEVLTEETVEGTIAYKPEGENGFGYDPIFWIPEKNQTFAQMSAEDKHAISHRGKALRALMRILAEKGELVL